MTDTIYLLYLNRNNGLYMNPYNWYPLKNLRAAIIRHGLECKFVQFNKCPTHYLQQMGQPSGAILTDILDYSIRQQWGDQISVISKWQTTYLNDVTTWDLAHNKLKLYNFLSARGVDMPITKSGPIGSFMTMDQAEECFSTMGGKLVVKPAYGWYGRDTFLVDSCEELIKSVSNIQVKRGMNVPIVIQQYVGDYPDVVLRVSFCGDYMACYTRIVSPFEDVKFNNDNKFKYRVPISMPNCLRQYVKQLKDTLKVDAASCDVLIASNGYRLTDVNIPGSFKLHDVLFKEDFADRMITRLKQKMNSSDQQQISYSQESVAI